MITLRSEWVKALEIYSSSIRRFIQLILQNKCYEFTETVPHRWNLTDLSKAKHQGHRYILLHLEKRYLYSSLPFSCIVRMKRCFDIYFTSILFSLQVFSVCTCMLTIFPGCTSRHVDRFHQRETDVKVFLVNLRVTACTLIYKFAIFGVIQLTPSTKLDFEQACDGVTITT